MNEELDKILFTYKGFDDNYYIESVWAEKHGNYYRIVNIPFFATSIAYGDIVSVENDNGELHYLDIIAASGHSTINISFFIEEEIDNTTKKLTELGCDWEGSHIKTYISVDIPQTVNYKNVKDFLNTGATKGYFDFREACIG
ncbi:uncharacterized protein DUF4265 [Chitinophaga skermanii]|uniref:Uncharacterized protein DUF4265 n=1 Tax=Chitinophaga skermanii TaxID=331697 RepID=A0A327Q9M0_9BACT|nr:DUF4265 domain-containing protein [Chitinophaga skermanii]RAJ00508.1 uncharacterized protein DUF4265 [Chitinophaga skermanii]